MWEDKPTDQYVRYILQHHEMGIFTHYYDYWNVDENFAMGYETDNLYAQVWNWDAQQPAGTKRYYDTGRFRILELPKISVTDTTAVSTTRGIGGKLAIGGSTSAPTVNMAFVPVDTGNWEVGTIDADGQIGVDSQIDIVTPPEFPEWLWRYIKPIYQDPWVVTAAYEFDIKNEEEGPFKWNLEYSANHTDDYDVSIFPTSGESDENGETITVYIFRSRDSIDDNFFETWHVGIDITATNLYPEPDDDPNTYDASNNARFIDPDTGNLIDTYHIDLGIYAQPNL